MHQGDDQAAPAVIGADYVAEANGEEVEPVFVPLAERLLSRDRDVTVELRRLEDGRLAVLAYSSLDSLVASCGDLQPWASLPADKPATPEQKQAHAAGVRAQADFARKVQAYADCAAMVAEARRMENDSIAILNRFLGGLIEKAPFNAADVLTGLAGATAGQTAALRAKAMEIARSGSLEISERSEERRVGEEGGSPGGPHRMCE